MCVFSSIFSYGWEALFHNVLCRVSPHHSFWKGCMILKPNESSETFTERNHIGLTPRSSWSTWQQLGGGHGREARGCSPGAWESSHGHQAGQTQSVTRGNLLDCLQRTESWKLLYVFIHLSPRWSPFTSTIICSGRTHRNGQFGPFPEWHVKTL